MKAKNFELFFKVWMVFCILLVLAGVIVIGHFVHKYW